MNSVTSLSFHMLFHGTTADFHVHKVFSSGVPTYVQYHILQCILHDILSFRFITHRGLMFLHTCTTIIVTHSSVLYAQCTLHVCTGGELL